MIEIIQNAMASLKVGNSDDERCLATEMQQMDPEVIELMISMVYWATNCRVPATFDPFPHETAQVKDTLGYIQIRSALDRLPTAQVGRCLINELQC